ncbi:MAG: NAD(P)/FAD-dependent oxidoreductase [Pseudomonadota bacterium]
MTAGGPEKWCVVGGGMLGLTLALRLAGEGKQVTVLEAADRLGGLADAWQIGSVTWDRHYHVILLSDRHVLAVLKDIGLDDQIRWTTTKTEFYTGQKFYPLNNALDYLSLPIIGMVDKARLAATILWASRLSDGRALERVRLEDWLIKLSGRRTWRAVWQPLVRAKLGENYRIASAAFIWAIIRRLYAARRSGLKTEMFGYVDGGYDRIIAAMAEALQQAGVSCKTSRRIRTITRSDAGGIVVTDDERAETYDRVVVTAAGSIAARMCPDLTTEERARLEQVKYQGIICASVLLKQGLNGAYLTYITDPDAPFTAVVEMSALVDRDQLDGRTLVYLPWYVSADDPAFELSDEEIEGRFMPALFRMYPNIKPDDVVAFRVSRVKNVLAISTLNYSAQMPDMTTDVPGLFVVNSSQIVNGTLNVNETIRLADQAMPVLCVASAQQGARTPGLVSAAGA